VFLPAGLPLGPARLDGELKPGLLASYRADCSTPTMAGGIVHLLNHRLVHRSVQAQYPAGG
jgi:hypothetical protein